MTVARVTELTSESSDSFEDAIKKGIDRATKTLKNVRSAWVKEQSVEIEGDQITRFRVDMKVTFVLDD